MDAGRLRGDEQFLGYLAVGAAGGDQAQDVAFAGIRKGFISIGRVLNEAAGMQVCAGWLETLVPEVPVRFIPAGDPYWRPL